MGSDRTRRSVTALLGTTVAGALAGCSSFENHPELRVFNLQDDPVVASVSMVRVHDDSEVYSETLELAADGDVRRQIDLSADYHRITTNVEGGPKRSAEWEPGGEGCCIEVHIEDDAIEHRVRAY